MWKQLEKYKTTKNKWGKHNSEKIATVKKSRENKLETNMKQLQTSKETMRKRLKKKNIWEK